MLHDHATAVREATVEFERSQRESLKALWRPALARCTTVQATAPWPPARSSGKGRMDVPRLVAGAALLAAIWVISHLLLVIVVVVGALAFRAGRR